MVKKFSMRSDAPAKKGITFDEPFKIGVNIIDLNDIHEKG